MWDEDDRLEPQRKRLRRAGIHNVRILAAGTAAETAPYDAVLVDAPCLGLGTLRRNPTLAWRGPLVERINEITRMQRECLESYAPLVRPGGIMVYATCSFEPEETTLMVERFLVDHPEFEPSPVSVPLGRYGLGKLVEGAAPDVLLLPSTHGTDGFYVARMKRRDRPSS